MNNRNQASFNFNGIAAFLILIAFFTMLFLIVKGIFTILLWAAPVLLIGALLLDFKGTLSFGTWVFKQLQKNILAGLIGVGLAAFFWEISLPAIAAFLFGKALLKKKIREVTQQYEEKKEGDFIEYEEIKSPTPMRNLELPPIQKRPEPKDKGSEYDSFFE